MRAPITLSSVLTNGYLSSEKPSWQDVESLGVERPHEKDSNVHTLRDDLDHLKARLPIR
ncbi:hypothetical protein Plhal304r1_c076g0163721 [Plasmopara halstedii]